MNIRKDVIVIRDPRSKNKPWKVRWWGKYNVEAENQPNFSRSFATKKLADKYAQSLKDDIDDGISVEFKKITLGKLCQNVLDAKKTSVASTTLKNYSLTAERLKEFFGDHCNIKTIKEEIAQKFVNDIELTRYGKTAPSDSTRAQHLRNAKIFFTKAVDWDYIRKNPFKKISLGKAQKENWHYITPAEFNAVIRVIDETPIRKNKKSNITEKQDSFNKIMLKAFYIIMHDCGLRFGEAVHLMWNDGSVDFINAKITIKNKPSKNGLPPFTIKDHETRSIPCTTRVIESLKELKKISNHNNPYVFLSEDRFETVKANWQELVEKGQQDKWLNSMMLANPHRKFVTYCTKAGIHTSERLCIHCLRKSFGTNLSDLGTPVHTLKDLMGHSNIQTTMSYYIKSSDANKMKAVEGLEKLAVA